MTTKRGPKPRVLRMIEDPTGPPLPGDLDAAERAHWRRVCRRLSEAGLLGRIDAECIAAYARVRGDLDKVRATLREKGMAYTTATGTIHARPEAALAVQYARLAADYERALGLTPAGRKRYSMATPRESGCTTAAAKYLAVNAG